MDDEVEFIWLREVPQRLYTRKELEDILLEFTKDCGKDESLYSYYAGDYRDLKQWTTENL